jgi:lipopolysaccharide biosynthesis regulator YciM
MERQAWDYTVKLAPTHDISVPDDIVQSTLDSYRDWIHERSTCPNCQATGIQTDKFMYSCPACSHEWKVNEARTCALRRYGIKTQ